MNSNIKIFNIKNKDEFLLNFKSIKRNTTFNIIITLNFNDFDNIIERLFELSNLSTQNNKSFVIVNSIFHNENLCVAPTVKEAHDIIEIEEIERDLLL
tara:strand:- start:146 stop:439 length:294 start_codon:yes stop_codon:yes gene_type:complete